MVPRRAGLSLILSIFSLAVVVLSADPEDGCTFPKHSTTSAADARNRLQKLVGKEMTAVDSDKQYTYIIRICRPISSTNLNGYVKSAHNKPLAHAGVVQYEKNSKNSKPVPTLVGDITRAEVLVGRNWVLLEYNGGDNYTSHCDKEERRALLMLTCNKAMTKEIMEVIIEQKNKTTSCYYLFEMEHQALCLPENSDLSVGSILCIVFLVVSSVYLIAGALYMRFFAGAKGLEQIPNFHFWQEFGNLQADGCDFVFRCGGYKTRSRSYRGIGEEGQMPTNPDDSEDIDDHILPM